MRVKGTVNVLDPIDIKLLRCLQENARQSASAIGEKVKLSVSAVIERIRKLEAIGVIMQYTVILNGKQIGKGVTAFISVRMDHPKFNDSFIDGIRRLSGVMECHYIAGDYDYLLKVAADSTEELTQLLGMIKAIQGVSLTKTMIVLSTEKNSLIPLPEESD